MRCSVTIGHPIRPERYSDAPQPHLAWRSMIDEVMFEVRELTGQTYRNCYTGHPDGTSTGDPPPADPVDVNDLSPTLVRDRALVSTS
jgi:hypothetical protein